MKKETWINIIGWLSLAVMLVAIYAVFIYAPRERIMGDVQRIFYFHVPSAWTAFMAFFVTFVASILYLWRSERRFDILAHASAEIGVIFTSLVLLTGPIWAKVAWNTWWTWDPRLTTATILWLIYVSYLMLRSAVEDPARRARFAAVFGIVGFVDVPIVFMAIRWWRTIHPVLFTTEEFKLSPSMLQALLISLLAFTLLYLYLLIQRVRLETMRNRVDDLKTQLGR